MTRELKIRFRHPKREKSPSPETEDMVVQAAIVSSRRLVRLHDDPSAEITPKSIRAATQPVEQAKAIHRMHEREARRVQLDVIADRLIAQNRRSAQPAGEPEAIDGAPEGVD